jgi:hypothetical protein
MESIEVLIAAMPVPIMRIVRMIAFRKIRDRNCNAAIGVCRTRRRRQTLRDACNAESSR